MPPILVAGVLVRRQMLLSGRMVKAISNLHQKPSATVLALLRWRHLVLVHPVQLLMSIHRSQSCVLAQVKKLAGAAPLIRLQRATRPLFPITGQSVCRVRGFLQVARVQLLAFPLVFRRRLPWSLLKNRRNSFQMDRQKPRKPPIPKILLLKYRTLNRQ